MLNNNRFDLSSRLIHFFRAIDLESDDAPFTPESWGPGDIVEDTRISPFFLLRNAVRLGCIWASWARRNNCRTVYGSNPAVCFTEMPLGAFIEAGEARARRNEAMSSYGLIFPKKALYSLGARPVIYGLSSRPSIIEDKRTGERLISADHLAPAEQYRFVTFALDASIDWTHEREWRWPHRGSSASEDGAILTLNGLQIPGLNLFQHKLTGLGAVVRTASQANRLIYDILTSVDSGRASYSQYEFVVALDKINDVSSLRDPCKAEELITNSAFKLDGYFRETTDYKQSCIEDLGIAIQEITAQKIPDTRGRENGGCWLWITDNRHPFVRALVAMQRIQINKEGRYLLSPEFDPNLDLSQREEMTRNLSHLLKERYELPSTYHTVLNSWDPDGVPHYSDPPLENRYHFNYAHEKGDY